MDCGNDAAEAVDERRLLALVTSSFDMSLSCHTIDRTIRKNLHWQFMRRSNVQSYTCPTG
jgi:hypothetical protein